MKEIKRFIIVNICIIFIKLIGGILCHSYTFLASAFYEFFLLFLSLVTLKERKNQKYKSIISSFTSFLFLMGSLSILFISVLDKIQYPSWFLILFFLISLLLRYAASCFTTNINYNHKKGILTYSGVNSTLDLLSYGIILCSLIISKLSSFLPILRYADQVGVCLIFLMTLIKSFSIMKRSFTSFKEDYVLDPSILKEIEKRKEVEKLQSVHTIEMGGICFIKTHLLLKDSISIMDLNTFIISLQDYLLKYGDIVGIYLIDKDKIKKKKVRSKKEDARNSRSRNSKANTKRKSASQKNKKR